MEKYYVLLLKHEYEIWNMKFAVKICKCCIIFYFDEFALFQIFFFHENAFVIWEKCCHEFTEWMQKN